MGRGGRRPVRAGIATVLIGLAGVGAAACGGVDRSQYQREAQAEGRKLERSLAKVGQEYRGAQTNPVKAVKGIQAIAVEVRASAKRFKAIEPPGDAESDHKKLVAGLEGFADDLETATKGADTGRPETLGKLAGLNQSASAQEVQRAIAALAEKGYRIE